MNNSKTTTYWDQTGTDFVLSHHGERQRPTIWSRLSGLWLLWSAFNRGLIFLFILKAAILFNQGEAQYRTRLAEYSNPTTIERLVLAIMRIDPLTLTLKNAAEQMVAIEQRAHILERL
ncbi:MAG: hypothetical protein GXP05_02425 [Alphaproteobacteria bacterium]|nr:hypothetical protein [Alphaproteobacteria bacterium]